VLSASGEGVRWGHLLCRLGQEECGYEHVRHPLAVAAGRPVSVGDQQVPHLGGGDGPQHLAGFLDADSFTPTYGFWMNLVERWFSALTAKKLQRSAHRGVKELAADILAWADTWIQNPKPFMWTKTAEDIVARLAGYCSAVRLAS
jgi:hypothetical protein